jgi:homoserine O-acetyltransferase
VRAQHRLVTEALGIETLECVLGGSMGALQAFQWAAAYPEMVARAMPICGAATTSEHNRVFLEALRGAIRLDPEWRGGQYERNPERALRHFGRIYAGWGFSQQYYWQRAYLKLGFSSLEDFLVGFWEATFLSRDANDLLAQLETWYHGDIGSTPGCEGDAEQALGRITARTFVVPAEKDLYFPPEDSHWEASRMQNAEVRVIPGIWGHMSIVGAFPEPAAFIGDCVRELLAA